MPPLSVLNVTVHTAEVRRRCERVTALGRRYRFVRWALSHELVLRVVVWWCSRPAMDRTNWTVG